MLCLESKFHMPIHHTQRNEAILRMCNAIEKNKRSKLHLAFAFSLLTDPVKNCEVLNGEFPRMCWILRNWWEKWVRDT